MLDLKKYKMKNENMAEYKERLYKNKKLYNISWEEIASLLGKEQNPHHVRKTAYGYLERVQDEKNKDKFDNVIMVINDVHAPHEREDFLEIISKHADEITTLVIAGDFMDCKSISSFPQINDTSLVDEIVYTRELLMKIISILGKDKKIVIIQGNHEARVYKTISKMNEKELQPFINPNIMEMIVDGFTIYKDGKNIKYSGIDNVININHWYVLIDSLVVAHPLGYSSVKGKMLENVVGHFINKGFEFDGVIFGHTHKMSIGVLEKFENKFAIENPCLCKPQSYSDMGKLGYNPQTYGFSIIKYNKGEKISLNNVKTYILEETTDTTKDYTINL